MVKDFKDKGVLRQEPQDPFQVYSVNSGMQKRRIPVVIEDQTDKKEEK